MLVRLDLDGLKNTERLLSGRRRIIFVNVLVGEGHWLRSSWPIGRPTATARLTASDMHVGHVGLILEDFGKGASGHFALVALPERRAYTAGFSRKISADYRPEADRS
jgi:hypothetical protein